jgi:hypothetical protein
MQGVCLNKREVKTKMTMVMSRAKWLIPVIVIVAMLAAVGIVWSQGSGDDGGGISQVTDFNPVYDDQLVVPSEAEAGLVVLYALAIDPPTSTVPVGSAALATITLTNLIEAPLANGSKVGSQTVMQNGDLTGNLIVSADVYNSINPCDCIASYDSGTNWTTLPQGTLYTGLTGECYPDATVRASLELAAAGLFGITNLTDAQNDVLDKFAAAAYAAANYSGANAPNGLPTKSDVIIKIYDNVTVHPGGTVTFQVPIIAGQFAPPGANFMIKAVFDLITGP